MDDDNPSWGQTLRLHDGDKFSKVFTKHELKTAFLGVIYYFLPFPCPLYRKKLNFTSSSSSPPKIVIFSGTTKGKKK